MLQGACSGVSATKNRSRNGEKHSPAQQDPSPYLHVPLSPFPLVPLSSQLPVPKGQLISAHDEIMGDDFPALPASQRDASSNDIRSQENGNMFDENESLDCGELADEASLQDAYFHDTRYPRLRHGLR